MAGLLGAPEESEAVGSLCNLGTLVPGLAAEVEVDRLPELLGEPRAATGDSLGAAGVADQPAQPRRGPTSRDRRCGVPPRRLEGLALAEQRPAVLHRAGARKGTPLQGQGYRPLDREPGRRAGSRSACRSACPCATCRRCPSRGRRWCGSPTYGYKPVLLGLSRRRR